MPPRSPAPQARSAAADEKYCTCGGGGDGGDGGGVDDGASRTEQWLRYNSARNLSYSAEAFEAVEAARDAVAAVPAPRLVPASSEGGVLRPPTLASTAGATGGAARPYAP